MNSLLCHEVSYSNTTNIIIIFQMPAGSDEKWAQKLYKMHLNKSKHFSKPRLSNLAFVVHHFADLVQYDTNGFVEKNRDSVNEEHLLLLKASEVYYFTICIYVIPCVFFHSFIFYLIIHSFSYPLIRPFIHFINMFI